MFQWVSMGLHFFLHFRVGAFLHQRRLTPRPAVFCVSPFWPCSASVLRSGGVQFGHCGSKERLSDVFQGFEVVGCLQPLRVSGLCPPVGGKRLKKPRLELDQKMFSGIIRAALTTHRGPRPPQKVLTAMWSSAGLRPPFSTLAVSQPCSDVTHVEINRPEKRNAMNKAFWREMVECFDQISDDSDCRAVLLSGAGKIFTAGIDMLDLAGDVLQPKGDDAARISYNLRKTISQYQESFSAIERCPKPVVVAVHGACVGGGVDLVTACDIRLCTQDAWFQVKEVDIGLAADVGTLQRLPKVIGSRSLVNELALTARKMYADEAKSSGLVSRVFEDKAAMMAGALHMAQEMASRSPVAVQGTKLNLLYSRDHSVAEGLQYMATWNMSMLQTEDVVKSAQAAMDRKSPRAVTFSKL